MGLDRLTLGRLQTAAAGFVTKNHTGYLADAIQCTGESGDPLRALQILHAMWDSSYASRVEQKAALNDVGKWLERRLGDEPNARAETLALELGWLRRLAQIAAASHERYDDPHPQGKSDPPLAFGKRIARIEEQRAAAVARVTPHRVVAAPIPVAPPPPDRLPPAFEAEFVDLGDARKARKTAREREQHGKPRKKRLLDIRPTDPQLVALAAGLVCSVTETEGFDAPFEAVQRNPGTPFVFYVTAFEEHDGRRLARVIALQPPPLAQDTKL